MERWESRNGMLSTARAAIRPERDRDGHLTVLDFNSSLIVLCTNVHKSKSLDPSTEWVQTDGFIHPIGSLRSLTWNGIIQRLLLIMPIRQMGIRRAVSTPTPSRAFTMHNAGLQLMFPLPSTWLWLTFHLHGAFWVRERACKEWDNWSFPSWLEAVVAFPLNHTEFWFAALDFTGSFVRNKAYRCEGLLQSGR